MLYMAKNYKNVYFHKKRNKVYEGQTEEYSVYR